MRIGSHEYANEADDDDDNDDVQLVDCSIYDCSIQLIATEAESDIPVHVRVHVHEGKISGRGLIYQGVVRVWSQDGGS